MSRRLPEVFVSVVLIPTTKCSENRGDAHTLRWEEDALMPKHIWCIPLGYSPLGKTCSLKPGTDGGHSSLLLEYISIEDDVAFNSVSRLTLTATQSRYLNHIRSLLFTACLVILPGFLKNICQPPCGDYDMLPGRLFIFAKMNSAPLSEVPCPKNVT